MKESCLNLIRNGQQNRNEFFIKFQKPDTFCIASQTKRGAVSQPQSENVKEQEFLIMDKKNCQTK